MFYDRYVELCRKNGMSPTGVARKVGISSRTAADWALGAEPRNSTLKRIADYFNVDVSYFYKDDEIENKDDKLVENFIEEMRQKSTLTEDENLMLMMFRSVTDEQRQELIRIAMRMVLKDETR